MSASPLVAGLPVLPGVAPAGASIRIDDALPPDRAAHVALGDFDGPLALLLALIEQRRMEILTVPLGELATAFLEAIAGSESTRLPHISAFIGVASQLILIKSRAILPRPPVIAAVEDDGLDPEEALRRRLIEYRRFRDLGRLLGDRLLTGARLHRREPGLAAAGALAGAAPPELPRIDPQRLVDALERAFRVVPPPPPPPAVIRRTVTLEERADVIRLALARAPVVVLQELLRGTRDRVVVAITFLALLEMTKTREVVITQDRPWGPIRCELRAPEPVGVVEEGSDD